MDSTSTAEEVRRKLLDLHVCGKCGKEKKSDGFHRSTYKAKMLFAVCKECIAEDMIDLGEDIRASYGDKDGKTAEDRAADEVRMALLGVEACARCEKEVPKGKLKTEPQFNHKVCDVCWILIMDELRDDLYNAGSGVEVGR